MSENPYWDEIEKLPTETSWRGQARQITWDFMDANVSESRHDLRQRLVHRYAWAIPSPDVLAFVVKHAGERQQVVEIGAGSGYWAWQLTQAGLDVVAYDREPLSTGSNPYHQDSTWEDRVRRTPNGVVSERRVVREPPGLEWHPVRKGRSWHASRWPDRTLMLCWPEYGGSAFFREPGDPGGPVQASSALRHYRGDRLIFIGEGPGGCTGDDSFFEELEMSWEVVDEMPMHQWPGINDWCSVHTRR